MLSESRKKANKKYDDKTYSRISLLVGKEFKKQIQKAAEVESESVNHYISKSVANQLYIDSNRNMFSQIYSDDYDAFRSNLAHNVKNKGRIRFIVNVLDEDLPFQLIEVSQLYGLYALSLLDYECRCEGIEYLTRYARLRSQKLKNTVWPSSVSLMAAIMNDDSIREKALKNAIPEFLSHNIVEGNIEDVQ